MTKLAIVREINADISVGIWEKHDMPNNAGL
jgi:hypothetical protein